MKKTILHLLERIPDIACYIPFLLITKEKPFAIQFNVMRIIEMLIIAGVTTFLNVWVLTAKLEIKYEHNQQRLISTEQQIMKLCDKMEQLTNTVTIINERQQERIKKENGR